MTHLPSVAFWSLIIGYIDIIISSSMYKINYRNEDSKEKIIKTIVEGSIYAETYLNEKSFTEYN